MKQVEPPPQVEYPLLQANPQPPLLQVAAALVGATQGLLHPPQCWVLPLVLVSQPEATLPSQLPHPDLQLEMLLEAPLHAGLALASVHAPLQAPQWLTLVFLSVSQPLLRFPSQFKNEPVHAMAHLPPLQAGSPLVELHT